MCSQLRSVRFQTTEPSVVLRHAVPEVPKWIYTNPCSMHGVGVAYVLKSCFEYVLSSSNSLILKISLPVFEFRQMPDISLPYGEAVVNHTCSPQTTGEDHPLPAMGIFHKIFCASFH